MRCYRPKFEAAGYDDLDIVADMKEDELKDDVGVSENKRRHGARHPLRKVPFFSGLSSMPTLRQLVAMRECYVNIKQRAAGRL